MKARPPAWRASARELPGATGLIVHNESVLGAVLELLRSAGRRVPQDVSVVAVCPQDVALGLPIPLTSIDIPAQELASLAVEMLIDLLEGRGVQTRLLAPALTERASCASR